MRMLYVMLVVYLTTITSLSATTYQESIWNKIRLQCWWILARSLSFQAVNMANKIFKLIRLRTDWPYKFLFEGSFLNVLRLLLLLILKQSCILSRIAHTNVKPFKCFYCDHHSNLSGNINLHCRLKHKGEFKPERQHQSTLSAQTRVSSNLRATSRLKHKGEFKLELQHQFTLSA